VPGRGRHLVGRFEIPWDRLDGDAAAVQLKHRSAEQQRQRHVAIAGRIAVSGLPPLRVVSVHLDPSGHRTEEAMAIAAHLGTPTAADETLIIGGDLNTWFGRREHALKALASTVPEEDCGRAKTNTWPWRMQWPFGWWRGRLDYVFSTLPSWLARSCQTVPQQFGSDHRPVVLVIPVGSR